MKKPIKTYDVEYATVNSETAVNRNTDLVEVKEQFYWCESIDVRCAVLE